MKKKHQQIQLTFAIYSDHFHFEVYSLLYVCCIQFTCVLYEFFCVCMHLFIHLLFVRSLILFALCAIHSILSDTQAHNALCTLIVCCSIGAARFSISTKRLNECAVKCCFLLPSLSLSLLFAHSFARSFCILTRKSLCFVLLLPFFCVFVELLFHSQYIGSSSTNDRFIWKEIVSLELHCSVMSWNVFISYGVRLCIHTCLYMWMNAQSSLEDEKKV